MHLRIGGMKESYNKSLGVNCESLLSVELDLSVGLEAARDFEERVIAASRAELFGHVDHNSLAGKAFKDESFCASDKHAVNGNKWDAHLKCDILFFIHR